MTPTLRHAEPADHAVVLPLVDAWWGGRPMRAMLPKLFFVHFRPTSFVAEADGAIRGFLIGFPSQTFPDQAYVHFVGVDPAHRGRGLARLLYDRFFAAVALLGCREVRCVTAPTNRPSLAFHRRLGFAPLPGPANLDGTPYTPAYDGLNEDRVLLRRPL